MITTLADYKAYFQALATTLGCSFVYANRGRVLAKQLSQITYPVLWLPVPDMRLNLADGKQYIFQGAAVFLTHAAADDYDSENGGGNGEQRRLEDLLEKQNQQTRDVQRRLDQTNERLEALKAIERSLTSRPPPPATAPASAPTSRNRAPASAP